MSPMAIMQAMPQNVFQFADIAGPSYGGRETRWARWVRP